MADELAAELEEFLKLDDEVTTAQTRVSGHTPDSFELRAVGSILHDIYQNAESIFQRVAKEIDRGVHRGQVFVVSCEGLSSNLLAACSMVRKLNCIRQ